MLALSWSPSLVYIPTGRHSKILGLLLHASVFRAALIIVNGL